MDAFKGRLNHWGLDVARPKQCTLYRVSFVLSSGRGGGFRTGIHSALSWLQATAQSLLQ